MILNNVYLAENPSLDALYNNRNFSSGLNPIKFKSFVEFSTICESFKYSIFTDLSFGLN